MAASKKITLEARGLIKTQLASLGFKKRKEDIYTRELNDETLGWVGMDMAAEHGKVWVNPIIGIRNQVIARLEAALLGIQFHPYIPTTLQRTLVDLIPGRGFNRWIFVEGASNEPIAFELGEAVKMYGVPFMGRFLDRHSILSVLCKPYHEHSIATRVYTVPLLMYSLGDFSGARKSIEEFTAEIENDPRQIGLRQSYRQFSNALSSLLGTKH